MPLSTIASVKTSVQPNSGPALAGICIAAFGVPFRIATRAGPVVTRGASFAFGLALVAIVTHSLFYDSLFEDPLFWGAFALSTVVARRVAVE